MCTVEKWLNGLKPQKENKKKVEQSKNQSSSHCLPENTLHSKFPHPVC